MLPFGAILAGGRNTRYGDLKAFARVGGRPIIERVVTALGSVTPDIILIAHDESYAVLGLPMRPDRVPGLGALGGLYTALHWAADERRPGIIALACDMPFVSSALLCTLLELADAQPAPDVVVPESEGPRALEPLCAYYSVRCQSAIEQALARSDVRMVGFHDDVLVKRVPLAEVRSFGDPAHLFLNVNSPEARAQAEQIAHQLDT